MADVSLCFGFLSALYGCTRGISVKVQSLWDMLDSRSAALVLKPQDRTRAGVLDGVWRCCGCDILFFGPFLNYFVVF